MSARFAGSQTCFRVYSGVERDILSKKKNLRQCLMHPRWGMRGGDLLITAGASQASITWSGN